VDKDTELVTYGEVLEDIYYNQCDTLALMSSFPGGPPEFLNAFDKIKSACDDLSSLLKQLDAKKPHN